MRRQYKEFLFAAGILVSQSTVIASAAVGSTESSDTTYTLDDVATIDARLIEESLSVSPDGLIDFGCTNNGACG